MICEAIATGGALYRLCEREDWPCERSVYVWLETYPDFMQKYARARDRQADRHADETVVIADECEDPVKARLQIDTRKWKAGQLAPKKYGSKVTTAIEGGDKPVQVETKDTTSRDLLNNRIAGLIGTGPEAKADSGTD
jgi:hypothetical protein